VAAAREGLLLSAHDVSEGGLAVAMAESAIRAEGGAVGVEAELDPPGDVSPTAVLFGESASRAVLSCRPAAADRLRDAADDHGVPLARVGTVGEAGGTYRLQAGPRRLEVPVDELARTYEEALPRRMRAEAGLTT
jgi:phosphoribosylformylglycinamidine synthase